MYNIERLLDVGIKLKKEADNCFESGHYLASIVLYGAVLEALLLSMCFVYPDEVRGTEVYERVKHLCLKRKIRKRGFFLEFSLNDLIKIGEDLGWLPTDRDAKTGIRWCKETRDLIHPARWLKPDRYFKQIHKLFGKAEKEDLKNFACLSKEIVEGVVELLGGKVAQDLEKYTRNYPKV